MRFGRFIIGAGASALLFATVVAQGQSVAITEFLASNRHGLIDGESNASDWIELYNGLTASISLEGWCLTDDRDNLRKWSFPPGTILHIMYPPVPHGPNYYFTREDSWVVERDNIINNYLPAVHNLANSYALIRLLRTEGLDPNNNRTSTGVLAKLACPGYSPADVWMGNLMTGVFHE